MAVGLNRYRFTVNEHERLVEAVQSEADALKPDLVDWARTTAWGEGGYYGRIFMNVAGREPNGIVPPEEYARLAIMLNDARGWAKGTLPTYQDRKAFFEGIVNGDPDPVELIKQGREDEVQRLIEDNEAEVKIELSQGKIRFTLGNVVLTSKLIDGTFPDYGRVIPQNNDKELIVDKKDFEAAVDRVSTISSERGRAVKLALSAGKLVLSVTNPDSGSATEELEVEYASDALDIGFNSRYLLDIAAQIEGEVAVLRLADPGSPTLVQDKDNKGALYVLMPMRV